MATKKAAVGAKQKDKNELVTSYLEVRRFIGFIGISLPVFLILFSLIADRSGPKESISAYFYSGGREILVGSLFAIGVFLFSYKGFDKDLRKPTDKVVSRLAAVGAVGIAFSPMDWAKSGSEIEPVCTWLQCTLSGDITKNLHAVFAVMFFGSLATFCLINFQRCEEGTTPNEDKQFRNFLFRILGYVIVVCTVAFIAGSLIPIPGTFVFWAETIAIIAFGLSWIIKGEAIEGSVNKLKTMRSRT
ncbi:MAG: hypothetical protein COB40_07410 [Marinosulfonomonas sp.]|nr:MAG: hypothetical protein COB40_07410 [Marinosulfonomonas sp.]